MAGGAPLVQSVKGPPNPDYGPDHKKYLRYLVYPEDETIGGRNNDYGREWPRMAATKNPVKFFYL